MREGSNLVCMAQTAHFRSKIAPASALAFEVEYDGSFAPSVDAIKKFAFGEIQMSFVDHGASGIKFGIC